LSPRASARARFARLREQPLLLGFELALSAPGFGEAAARLARVGHRQGARRAPALRGVAAAVQVRLRERLGALGLLVRLRVDEDHFERLLGGLPGERVGKTEVNRQQHRVQQDRGPDRNDEDARMAIEPAPILARIEQRRCACLQKIPRSDEKPPPF